MTDTQKLNFLEPLEVADLAKRYGTPLFVYDLKAIRQRLQYFQDFPSAFGLTVRYSVKANPNGAILQLFDRLGVSFDASSVWEAERVLRAGISPKKILMTAQEASAGWIELCQKGMEFDAGSLRQLEEYGSHFPGTEVSVRFNPGFGSGLVKKLTSGGAHSSFGIWHEYVPTVKRIVAQFNLTIKRLHFHIGSGHEGVVLERTVARALELCEHFPSVFILDLGGGYRLKALNTDVDPDHRAMAIRIKEEIERFNQRTGRRIHLELEPGTYLMSMSGSLISRVIDVVDTGEHGTTFVKIDAGLTEIIRPSYYGALHPLVGVAAEGTLPVELMDAMVVGHCCIAGDNLTPKMGSIEDFEPVRLGKINEGDLLVVERAGGYLASMALKNFNSYPESAEILRVTPSQIELIRSRQSLLQIVTNEIHLSPDVALGEVDYDTLQGDIEGDENVQLAPVYGSDDRRQLSKQLFWRRPLEFLAKFTFAIILIACGFAAFVFDMPLAVKIIAFFINGFMFAHLVELQHECLHNHAFKSRWLNRFFGVLAGFFMVSSHSHYRYDHLRHHATLGTAENREHFSYRFQSLDSLLGFFCAFFDLSRFARVAKILWLTLMSRSLPEIENNNYQRWIKQEYVIYVSVAGIAIAWTLWSGSTMVLLAWFLPVLLISEGVHFMIEMPEHFGLNTQTEPDVFSNTRTIKTNRLGAWFVNGNNLHTAHHYHQGIPMCNAEMLNRLIESKLRIVEISYLDFYKQVISGSVQQQANHSCMVR